MNEAGPYGGFQSPFRSSGGNEVECMGSKGGQEMLLDPIAENRGFLLPQSRPGLVSTLFPTDICLFI